MEAKAIARFIKMSPRKVRLLADVVRGKGIDAALLQLQLSIKGSKIPLIKLLQSAIANAQGNKMVREKLYIKAITVDGGPVAKRSRPRAMGRAFPIRQRTSHITIVLGEK